MKAGLVLVGLAAACVGAIASVHVPAHQTTSSIDADLAGAICTATKE